MALSSPTSNPTSAARPVGFSLSGHIVIDSVDHIVYTNDKSWDIMVVNAETDTALINTDPDFPRFSFDDDDRLVDHQANRVYTVVFA